MKSLYVISAVAKDQPGLVHSITNTLAQLNVNIVDIDARSVRGHFAMFLVVDLGTSAMDYAEMMRQLKPVGAKFSLGLRVEPYQEGRRKAHKQLMLLTVMGQDRPGVVATVSGLCSAKGVNLETVKMIARGDYIAMEMTLDVSESKDVEGLRDDLYGYSETSKLDVSLRPKDAFEKPKRVVLFDCDSTIIQEEVIDELAEAAGVGEHVKKVTAKAMNGEVGFDEAIRQRVRLLKGMREAQLEVITNSLNLTAGAEELVSTLHFMGYKVGVVSGGFSFFTDYLKKRLNLDYVYANELEIKDGQVTGEIKGEIVNAERKGDILVEIAAKENISIDQIVAVGDGANDRFMLENAGLAIAFSPKAILKKYADGMISSDNISGLLYFMGIPGANRP